MKNFVQAFIFYLKTSRFSPNLPDVTSYVRILISISEYRYHIYIFADFKLLCYTKLVSVYHFAVHNILKEGI